MRMSKNTLQNTQNMFCKRKNFALRGKSLKKYVSHFLFSMHFNIGYLNVFRMERCLFSSIFLSQQEHVGH